MYRVSTKQSKSITEIFKYITDIILGISDIQTLSCYVLKIECGIESMESVGP